MKSKIGRLALLMLAPALYFANTDLISLLVVGLLPLGTDPTKARVLLVLIGNIETVIWFYYGRNLVPVFASFHLYFVDRLAKNSQTVFRRFFGWGASTFRPFYEWEDTKAKLDVIIDSLFTDWRRAILTFGSWLLLPGARGFTAIVFGMNARPGWLVLLLGINTIHILLVFGVWSSLIGSLRWLVHVVF